MKVPLADLHAQYVRIRSEIDSAIGDVITSSQFILGSSVERFEESFARAHDASHCIAVGSGTDALHLALWAAGIGKGDAVVTTPFTFIATVEAISLAGAIPVFVDIEPRTYTLDPNRLEELFRRKHPPIKAIIPVHLYGLPAAMNEIQGLAEREGAIVIEDACQAHLARYRGRTVGGFGLAGCFSFYPGKNLGAYGEAGAVTTNDSALAGRIRQLRDHGQTEKYRHAFYGHNYRMDGIQGAVLGVKMKYLPEWTLKRRELARFYKDTLGDMPDVRLPFEPQDAEHVYHQFVIGTPRREELQRFLSEREITTGLHYPVPLHLQAACGHLGHAEGDFPVSESAARECLSLPLFPEMTGEQIEHVATSVRSFFRS